MKDKTEIFKTLERYNLSEFADCSEASALWAALSCSGYARRHQRILADVMRDATVSRYYEYSQYDEALLQYSKEQSIQAYGKTLRYFRHYHMLRLWLRELAGYADTIETMSSWSDCAEVIIMHALSFCEQELALRYGIPQNPQMEKSVLFTLGMGKLGGHELNFSSDIDLIFVYSEGGQTSGPSIIDNQQYFSTLVQRFVHLLQDNTVDGFVFRVDLRLRPFGDSGPVAISKTALETYYQEQGRDWERYAMVKARVLGKTQEQWFDTLILPFVYRRYVDYSVIESLRSMKAMIERELRQNPRFEDIKRGKGGIREIEFIIQNVQLIRGGRLLPIRQRNAVAAINALAKQGLLDRSQVLEQAYLFYRKLENVLQIQEDEQRHHLPKDAERLQQISRVMGFEDSERLQQRIQQYQRIVSHLFQAVLGEAASFEDDNRVFIRQLSNLWQGHVEENMAVNWLTSMGFQAAERCYKLLQSFRHSARVRRLSQTATIRLDRFMIRLLPALRHKKYSDEILLRLIHLLEKIVGRSAYLALLAENPSVLEETIEWFEISPFISNLLIHNPFLLEVLVDFEAAWRPWSRSQLNEMLDKELSMCSDEEQAQECFRQFKLKCTLMIARSELSGKVTAIRAGRFLADLAQVLVKSLCQSAIRQLSERYPELAQQASKFSVVAYGKAGSREMNYDSDLDLVFLHRMPVSMEPVINRLTQKILHILTVRTQSGVLYSVDTRLRPSGSAGLLVSPLEAFVQYQQQQAWVWEHQALLKARVFYGTNIFSQHLYHLKRQIIINSSQRPELLESVQSMRTRVGYSMDASDIKHIPGGLLDLEFLLQYQVLAYGDPMLARYTNSFSILQQLYARACLKPGEFACLKEAYQKYHHCLHQQILQNKRKTAEINITKIRELIEKIYLRKPSIGKR